MRVLLDTNILIAREDSKPMPENVAELLKLLQEAHIDWVIHPDTIRDIARDKDESRRQIVLSKLDSYPKLNSPPNLTKENPIYSKIRLLSSENDEVDDNLLFCANENIVSFLITEDLGIHKNATKLGISDKVLKITDAIQIVKTVFLEQPITVHPSLELVDAYNIDILEEPIFNDLLRDYAGFEKWWQKLKSESRQILIHRASNSSKIEAILILKIEPPEQIAPNIIMAQKCLKICTLKVVKTGYKLGELFIKKAIEKAIANNLDEIYLTHFTKDNDYLVPLIEDFGFNNVGKKDNGEDIFIKRLVPQDREQGRLLPQLELLSSFYPCFHDGVSINKYLIPIKPKYHSRLFPECKRLGLEPLPLILSNQELVVEGNTINKAYLCHAPARKLKSGDIILFYRSKDDKRITTIGVIERIEYNITDFDTAMQLIAKKTVYSQSEIVQILADPTTIIIFKWLFDLRRPVAIMDIGGFSRAPQSIAGLTQQQYESIKRLGGIDERFTFD
jgi:predicted nucleic acid-binding protein